MFNLKINLTFLPLGANGVYNKPEIHYLHKSIKNLKIINNKAKTKTSNKNLQQKHQQLWLQVY